MTNNKDLEELTRYVKEAIPVLKERNKLTKKQNRLAKLEYQQSVLNFEQVERQYLIEKSRLQPTFKLSVTEFLTCEVDFVNDPEQASEVKFLADHGVGVDERVIRVKVQVKGDAEYMRPSLVVNTLEIQTDGECAYAMSDLLYFIPVDKVTISEQSKSIDAYFVYKDKTTLPVLHKYRFIKRTGSALLRWDAEHLDTAYATTHKKPLRYRNAIDCDAVFLTRK